MVEKNITKFLDKIAKNKNDSLILGGFLLCLFFWTISTFNDDLSFFSLSEIFKMIISSVFLLFSILLIARERGRDN